MAENESGQERTEDATVKRRDKAFEEGRIPRSMEFSGAMILLAGVGALAMGGGTAVSEMLLGLTRDGTAMILAEPFDERSATAALRNAGRIAFLGMMPMIAGIATVALGANLLQARGVLSVHPVQPKWSHLSPLKGVKKILSVQSVFNLVKSVLKLVFLTAVTYSALSGAWAGIAALSSLEPAGIVLVIRDLSVRLATVTGLAFLAVSLADYLFQVSQFEKQLRMTKQEVKQEHKESEGDPLIKSRIRGLQMQMSRKRMLQDVETADVVVSNPTHRAVALKYDPEVAPAPIVLAMGERKLAERIKAIAFDKGVPVIENKPLAQALLATAAIGQPVPPALYVAVAEVIAFVYQGRQGNYGRTR